MIKYCRFGECPSWYAPGKMCRLDLVGREIDQARGGFNEVDEVDEEAGGGLIAFRKSKDDGGNSKRSMQQQTGGVLKEAFGQILNLM
jgi:hypothetical protein